MSRIIVILLAFLILLGLLCPSWFKSTFLEPELFSGWVTAVATCVAAYGAIKVIPRALGQEYKSLVRVVVKKTLYDNMGVADDDREGIATGILHRLGITKAMVGEEMYSKYIKLVVDVIEKQ